MRSVEEWIGEHDDQPIPAAVKERVWKKSKDRCQGECRRQLTPADSPEIDHVVALCNGGEHREKNLRLCCSWCHGRKTRRDVAEKFDSSRTYRALRGIKTPARCPVAGSRNTPYALRYDRERGCFRTVARAR